MKIVSCEFVLHHSHVRAPLPMLRCQLPQVVTFSWLLLTSPTRTATTMAPQETALLLMAGGYLKAEIDEGRVLGWSRYFTDAWNGGDIGILVLFFVIASLRVHSVIGCTIFAAVGCTSPARLQTEDGHHSDTLTVDGAAIQHQWLDVLYASAMAITGVLLWLRLLFVFTIHPRLGPFLRIVPLLVGDVLLFLALTAAFFCGSTFAFCFLLRAATLPPTGSAGSPHFITLSHTVIEAPLPF